MRLRLIAAITVAIAVLPAGAAELDADGPPDERRPAELPVDGVRAPRVDATLDGLGRLRLHPGRDGLDVTEATRRHPRARTE